MTERAAPGGDLSARLAHLTPAQRALFERRLRELSAAGSRGGIPRRAADVLAPLTAAQELLWTLQRAMPGLYAYNVPRVLVVRGALDVDALRAALGAVVARHEILRTRFVATLDGPRQVVDSPRVVPLEVIDVRDAASPSGEAAARQLVAERARVPFDLDADLGLRATVIRCDDAVWYVLLVTHHLTNDETSRDILFRELSALYDAARRGDVAAGLTALPPLQVQFADFAAWQNAEMARGALDGQIAYWRKRLAGLGSLALPTDRPRTSSPSFAGARHRLVLPDAVREGVHAIARTAEASPFMVLLAAVKTVLSRYAGQRDIAVGAPVSGRRQPEIEHVIGYFPSQVVLRTEVDPSLSFVELVTRVRETCLGAFEHQDVPIERLLNEIPDRDDSGAPLFRVSVQMAGGAPVPPSFGDADVQIAPTDVGSSKFDLTFGFEDSPAGLRALIEYRTDLFDASTIERLGGHLRTLLESVIANPRGTVATAPMLTHVERAQLLETWNDSATPFDSDAVLPDLVARTVARAPDAIAVRGADGRTLTYAELGARADRLAALLQRAHGVRPGARVGVLMRRTPELVTAVLAVLKAGGAYIPIDPVYPPRRVETMLADAGAVCVITLPDLVAQLAEPDARPVLALDESGWPLGVPRDDARPAPLARAGDAAYVIYTSGSTGTPKGAVITHRGLVNYLEWAVRTYQVGRGIGSPVHSSISFDLTVTSLWTPLLAGRTVHLVADDDGVDGLVELLRREKNFSVVKITPAHLELLQQQLGPAAVADRVRYFVIGGEALYGESLAFWQRHAPSTIHVNEYGPTETVVGCCVEFVTSETPVTGQVPIGKPIANTRLYVLDAAQQLLPVGVPGELYIGGVGVCDGYLARPELTAEKFVRDPFVADPSARMYRTGDLARRRPDGVLEYLGRVDHQVKLRGYRVELGEVEEAIARCQDVGQCVVVVREDAPGDRRLAAYVVPATAARQPNASAIRATLGDTLPSYMVPDAIAILDVMPLNANGKADRKALLALPSPFGETGDARPRREPRTAIEQMLVEEWSTVLRRDRIGVDDDFFALGGHSLLAMRVIGRVIERTGVRLPLRAVFERRTVAGLAAAIAEARSDAPVVPIPPLVEDIEAPLSYGQELLWLMQIATPGLSAYNMPQAWTLRGPLDVAALDRALGTLQQRHAALRAIVVPRGEHATQRLRPAAQRLVVEDLSTLAADERDAVARARAEALAAEPFDLSREPAFRATLLRLAPDHHQLLFATHHAMADGWSIGVITRELASLYANAAAPLPAVPVQFPAYAAWERSTRTADWLAGELEWWRGELAGGPTTLDLPTDRPRPASVSFDGGRRMAMLPREVLDRLRAIATAEGTTLYSVLLAAYAVFLHRYSRQSEVVVGTVVANRHRPDLDQTVGYFANTIPLRVSLADDPSFAALVRRVHDVFLRASEHSDVPFEHLALALHDGARANDPLVQALFILQNNDDTPLSLTGLAVERLDVGAAGAKFELTLSMTERDDGLRTVFQYRRALFDEGTVDRMLAHLATLIEAAAARPGAAASALTLVPANERTTLVRDWNATDRPIPEAAVPALVRAAARRNLESRAVSAPNGTLSYRALLDRSASIASALVQLGVRPGSRVAVCMDRSTDLVAALLGVLRAGAAYVPLDPAYPAERTTYVLGDAGVDAIVVDAAAPPLGDARCSVLRIDAPIPAVADADFTDAVVEPDALAYVLYTSGSTGRPKGVMISHRALVNFLSTMAERPGLAAGDTLVAVTTISFDIAGLELWLPLVTGAETLLVSREVAMDGAALRRVVDAAVLRTAGNVMLQATPATWRLLLESGWAGASKMVLLCGGEAWPAGLAAQLRARGSALWNVYGPTETTIWSTRALVTTDDVSLGEPLANTTLFVLEPTGQPAPFGVPGELWIGGAGLARGYHERPELTAERFVVHPDFGRLYRTGDLVRRTPDGRLTYLGRLDDQVKVRGYRIELGEIENVLAAASGVTQAVVALRSSPGGEPRLVAYVVTADHPNGDAALVAAIGERLRAALPEYMVPSAIVRLASLPLTPNGKVDRRALPAPSDAAAVAARPYVAPRTPLETQIAGVWRDVLGVDRVGVDDDFFSLGGHSLLAMRVIARLADVLPSRLTIATLFEGRTVARIAEQLSDRSEASGAAVGRIPRRAAPGPAALSHAQEMLWLYEQMTPGGAAYNFPVARRVRGPLDVAALQRAFATVVARHEALRTTFAEADGVVRQVVAPHGEIPLAIHDLRGASKALAGAHQLLRDAAAAPFDLARGPSARATLVRLADDDALLLFVVHHIAFDGGSVTPLMRDLAAAYDAAIHGGAPRFDALPIQLADYAAWERETLTDERLAPSVAWWRDYLSGAPAEIELPTDMPRTAANVGPGARYATTLRAVSPESVRMLGGANGATTFMVLLTAFMSVLRRYSGQDDLVVGAAVAGRERPETAGLVGYLANTLAVRARFDDDPTFAELLGRVRSGVVQGLEHQRVPYEKLVRELRAGLPAAEHALFRVMFTLQDASGTVTRLGDATLDAVGIDIGAAKFDLTVSVTELADGFRFAIDYRRDLFAETSIARVAEHFGVLLASAVAAPATRVSSLALMTGAEWTTLVRTWNDTRTLFETATLVGLMARQVSRTPDAIAVEDERRSLTFARLDAAATALARRLRSHGVGPNVLVGICAERSVELVVGLVAILKAGGAYVPLDPEYPRDRLEFMLEDSGVAVLLAQPAVIKDLALGAATVISLDGVAAATDSGAALPLPSPSDAAYMIYTSGSTGRPKGALNAHSGIVNRVLWMDGEYRLTSADVVLQKTPFSFDVSVWEFFWPLTTGATLVVARPGGHRDTAYLADVVSRRGVTVCHFVPSMLRAFVSDPSAANCVTLRDVMASGEALPPALVADFYRTLPRARLHNLYGPTECAVDVTYWPCPPSSEPPTMVPIGRPVANTQMYVLDAHGQPTPIGVPGELFIGGVQVGLGYHNRPELTSERFVRDPFSQAPSARLYRTGDKARWRADGTIEYLGRLDFQVKIRGFRIELGEIEATLARHPRVEDAVVVARPLVPGGDPQLVAYYVPAGDAVPAAALRDDLRVRLPDYMVPAVFMPLQTLPLNASGKVDRRALPAPVLEEPPDAHVAPRNDVETVVAGVWRDILGRERVGVETSFFDLGGHSLLATRITGQVTKIFRTALPLRRFFESPTVAGLARALMDAEAKPGQTATIARLFLKAQRMTPEERERLRRDVPRTDQTTTGIS